jgi:hypothetical protein
MKNTNIFLMLLMTVVLTLTARVGASMILFDDKVASGWSGTWYMNVESSNVYSGSSSLSSSNGQFELSSTGLNVDGNCWLEAWVNTSNATTSNVEVFLSYGSETKSVPFDNRNVPTTYYLDGVETKSGKTGIAIDPNPSTWQLLRINLTQTTYTGWPHISHNFNPQTDDLLQVRFVGSYQLLLDDVSLISQSAAIPEPATMSLLAIGVLALIHRKK